MKQQRLLAVHDISCVGKCSLTVALPIISAAGIETSVLPTAVLSTHTGGFTGYTFRDLTDDIIPIVNHWESLKIEFDGIYTGFLGSFEQIKLVCEIFERLKKDRQLKIVDPVMADDGKLYTIFDSGFPASMRTLCEKADIIIPNITEACLLVGETYIEGPYSEEYIKNLLSKLSELGVKQIVLTGVYFDSEMLGAACYNTETKEMRCVFGEKIEGYYHGTGDIFGSVLTAALLCGKTLEQASQLAVDFTVDSIRRTKLAGTEKRYGVNFEAGLAKFSSDLGLLNL